jgi:CDP-diacylglycerol--glycerol-3-phosphate 3-phosphatidyltransferase
MSEGSTISSDWSEIVGKKAPNLLTFFRILLVPVFVWLMADATSTRTTYAAVVFIIASVTDWMDGYIARLFKAESIIGVLLDPIADKVLVTAALVMLAASPGPIRIPAWIVVLLLAREFLVSGLRSLAGVKGIVVPASLAAKYKTAFTLIAIILLLLPFSILVGDKQYSCHSIGMFALYLALCLSLFSGFDYAVKLRRLFWE